MGDLLILGSILLVGIVLVLALRKFHELDTELSIRDWITFRLSGRERDEGTGVTVSETDLRELIERHNADFCTALASRDLRYLEATTTRTGLEPARRHAQEVMTSMQRHGVTSCRFVGYSLAGRPTRAGNRATVDVDETWEYGYADGQIRQSAARNQYELVLDGGQWRVESCKVLTPSAWLA